MFAVIAAAGAAGAAELVDFDGKFRPQTMHDIFTNSHQLIPAPTPAQAVKTLNLPDQACGLVCVGGQLTNDCQCEPYYPWPDDTTPIDWDSIYQYIQNNNSSYCVPVASGPWWTGCVTVGSPITLTAAPEIPGRSFRSMSPEQQKQLALYYELQKALKKAVLARSVEYNFSPEAAAFVSNTKTKILYDNSKVYVTNGRILLTISDDSLTAKAKELRTALTQSTGTRGIGGDLGVVIACMSNDNCWGAVGDAVSDATEWYVTHVQDHTGDVLLNTPD